MKETNSNESRYIVLKQKHHSDNETFNYSPTKTHKDYYSAKKEAVRLATYNQGHTFDVAEISCSITARDFEVVHHKTRLRYS